MAKSPFVIQEDNVLDSFTTSNKSGHAASGLNTANTKFYENDAQPVILEAPNPEVVPERRWNINLGKAPEETEKKTIGFTSVIGKAQKEKPVVAHGTKPTIQNKAPGRATVIINRKMDGKVLVGIFGIIIVALVFVIIFATDLFAPIDTKTAGIGTSSSASPSPTGTASDASPSPSPSTSPSPTVIQAKPTDKGDNYLGNLAGNLNNRGFTVTSGDTIFVARKTEIYKRDKNKTNEDDRTSVLKGYAALHMNVYNNHLFFIAKKGGSNNLDLSNGKIYSLDLTAEDAEPVEIYGGKAENLIVTAKSLYFREGDALKRLDLNEAQSATSSMTPQTIYSTNRPSYVNVCASTDDGEYVFFIAEGGIYSIKVNATAKSNETPKKIMEGEFTNLCLANSRLIYSTADKKSGSCDLAGENIKNYDLSIGYMVCYNGFIYYTEKSGNKLTGKIKKLPINDMTSSPATVVTLTSGEFTIVGDGIYLLKNGTSLTYQNKQ